MAQGLKYTRRLRLSGPSKPIATFDQLLKANEKKRSQNTLFGGEDALGLGSKPKGYKWKKPEKSTEQKQAELAAQEAARKAKADEGFQLGDIWDVAENAVGDVKDIAAGLVPAAGMAVQGVKDNGWRLWDNPLDFASTMYNSMEDSYKELPGVANIADAGGDFVDNLQQGNFKNAGSALWDLAVRTNPITMTTAAVLDKGPMREPEYKDYQFRAFADRVKEDPVFYALDVLPGTGAGSKALKAAKVAGNKSVIGAPIVARAERMAKWRQFAQQAVADRARSSAAAATFGRAVREVDPDTAFIVQQVAHGVSPENEVLLRAARKAEGKDVAEDLVLNEHAPRLQKVYKEVAEKFVKPYQAIEKALEDGKLTVAEADAEFKSLLQKFDKDSEIGKAGNLYHLMKRAADVDAKANRLLDNYQEFLRKYEPLMILNGDLPLEKVLKNFREVNPGIAIKGFVSPLRGNLGIGVVIKGSKSNLVTVKYLDTKGRVITTVNNVLLNDLKSSGRFVGKTKGNINSIRSIYYDDMITKLNAAKGDDIVPMFVHHADRARPISTGTLSSEPRAAAQAGMRTDYSIWKQGKQDRRQLLSQYQSMLGGVNYAMRRNVMEGLVKSASDPSYPGVKIITKTEDLPEMGSGWKVLKAGDKEFDSISTFIMEGYDAAVKFNQWAAINAPDRVIKIPKIKHRIEAVAISDGLYSYVKTTLGFEKEAVHWIEKSTNWWKVAVLSMRPAFVVNNVVGNQTMAMINDPGVIREQIINTIKKRDARLAKDISYNTQMFQEDFSLATTTFGRSEFVDWEKQALNAKYDNLPATKQALQRFKQVAQLGFTASAMHEESLRFALIARRLKHDPRIKELMAADKLPDATNSTKLGRAWSTIKEEQYGKDLHDMIVHDVNKVMGDYRYYSPFERKLKLLIPFYGWYRHVMKYFAKEIADPVKGRLAAEVGRNREDYPELASFPAFAKNFIPFDNWLGENEVVNALIGDPKSKNRERYLDLSGVNPFATVPEVLDALMWAGNVGGKPMNDNAVLSMVNPLATGVISGLTGTDIRTGKSLDKETTLGGVGGVAEHIIDTLPQVRLAQAALGNNDPISEVDPNDPSTYLTPTGREKKAPKPTAYDKSFSIVLANFFGIPVRDINRESMEALGERVNTQQGYFKYPGKPRDKHKPKDKTLLDLYLERNDG